MDNVHFTYACEEGSIQVEVVFEGAIRVRGNLKRFSHKKAYITLDKNPPDVEKCFTNFLLGRQKVYSRGKVTAKDSLNIEVLLENWIEVFQKTISLLVSRKSSTLGKSLSVRERVSVWRQPPKRSMGFLVEKTEDDTAPLFLEHRARMACHDLMIRSSNCALHVPFSAM